METSKMAKIDTGKSVLVISTIGRNILAAGSTPSHLGMK
jgi:hypothetical protein